MSELSKNIKYQNLLNAIKDKIQHTQLRAIFAANQELIILYWHIGKMVLERQKEEGWGANVINQLSKDIKTAYPEAKGYSPRNLGYMKRFALTYPKFSILQAALAKLTWYHNITLLQKCPDEKKRLWYAEKVIEYGWSRDVMVHQIELNLYEREGKAITNFSEKLPAPQSDLAQKTLKDPYIFDFLGLEKDFLERELEDAIVKHITKFLLELGAGFAFIGRQYYVEVGGDDFYIDLLFYHLELRCYIAIDLKIRKFKPEDAGKMNFYLSVLDDKVKKEYDNPSIGIILCKDKNNVMAEYALKDISKPIGVSEYQLTRTIPENLKSKLPSIEDLERELKEIEEEE